MNKHKFDYDDEIESIIKSIQRVSKELGKTPTQKEYERYRNKTDLSIHQVFYRFGTWSEAVTEAGLEANPFQEPPQKDKISKDELIDEFIRVSNLLGKIPSGHNFRVNSKFSWTPYKTNWGSWRDAVDFIVENYRERFSFNNNNAEFAEKSSKKKKKLCYNCCLKYEPSNEFETIALFVAMCDELGYEIKTIRADFPDAVLYKDGTDVLAEFEFLSSNYLQHCHPMSFDGLCICWRRDKELDGINILSLEEYIRLNCK